MEETLRQKQLFLRENILDKGYSTDDFMDLLHSKKGEEGLDLNNWTMRELSLVVKEFISYENPIENPDNIKPSPETDEDYEQNCFQKYKEQKMKENQEYANCTRIEKSRLINRNEENLNIKVILPNKDMIKEPGEFLVETFPNKYQVKRNMEDFSFIFKYLNEQYKNYMIPLFSNKNYGEKYNEEKALKRTRALKKFLEAIALHPTLKHINILNDFLSINSEEDFLEAKKKYLSKDNTKENSEQKISLEDFKSLSGKIKVSITKEKEVYFMNIKDNTKINEGILKKINKSYKGLIGIMNNACEKMKEISDLWKLLSDKSQKYYETLSTIESYKIMNKITEELLISETKKISFFNNNIREYFRFVKNEFHSLNNLANKVESWKDKYYKAFDKLKQDKEKMFKEQDINSWGLNDNDLKHKNVFLKNKELAFSKMMIEETSNVLSMKNVYGAYLNSLIDEYERIRIINGKKNKENTIKLLKALGGNFKFINISCESHIDNFVKIKDEEISENEFNNYNGNANNGNNLFNNRNSKQYYNNEPSNERINFRNNNNMRINNNNQNIGNNRDNFQQQRRNNNQININNNQKQMNMNINRNNNIINNQNDNQYNNQYNRRNNQNSNQYNNQFIRNNNQNNNQYNNQNNRGNPQYDSRNNMNQQIRNNNNNYNNNQFNRNQNSQYRINNQNNNQYNRNNVPFDMNRSNQNYINNNRNMNQEQKIDSNNNKNEFYDINNINDYKINNNDDDNYDFHINRNNDINIYDF